MPVSTSSSIISLILSTANLPAATPGRSSPRSAVEVEKVEEVDMIVLVSTSSGDSLTKPGKMN